MAVLLGFDPGGVRRFGWAVLRDRERLPLPVVATGLASEAAEAVSLALDAVPPSDRIVAAGIDAPLFWSRRGGREVDSRVRDAIAQAGAPHPSGTVQAVNSLRGACLAQGMLAGVLLREHLPAMLLTEAHPKALLRLETNLGSQVRAGATDHERDAILAAVTAWAAAHRPAGWRDLRLLEPSPFSPLEPPLVAYWMPGIGDS